ncbi:MAG: lipocalin-like domain-containing protein, partial [Chloroflexota bacterium]|nr:lipocalin-like domain-containing protein [Chloroflexota bacterium]
MSQYDLALGRSTSPPATSESLSQNLIGTWRLLALEALGADGVVRYRMGEDAVGYLIYTADGYMSGHLMRPGRAGFERTIELVRAGRARPSAAVTHVRALEDAAEAVRLVCSGGTGKALVDVAGVLASQTDGAGAA